MGSRWPPSSRDFAWPPGGGGGAIFSLPRSTRGCEPTLDFTHVWNRGELTKLRYLHLFGVKSLTAAEARPAAGLVLTPVFFPPKKVNTDSSSSLLLRRDVAKPSRER